VARERRPSDGSAVADTLWLFLLVGLLRAAARLIGLAGLAGGLFVLSAPLELRPWTLVTSVYAHAGAGHLLANAVALAVVGPLVERRTTRLRFHAFFAATGGLAGVAEVTLGGVLAGDERAVLGGSGAVFALLGYLLAGNVVTARLLDRVELSPRAQVALFLAVAAAVAVATAGPGVALIAHATGLLLGLLAGRVRLLDVRGKPKAKAKA